jgi:hypothetical protein
MAESIASILPRNLSNFSSGLLGVYLFFVLVILKITETLLVNFDSCSASAIALSSFPLFILRLYFVLHGCETKMLSI